MTYILHGLTLNMMTFVSSSLPDMCVSPSEILADDKVSIKSMKSEDSLQRKRTGKKANSAVSVAE